ncbi:disulfide bond formation protein B, partial [Francisella tularensis subsp. holarctica]|nr:disulfide bond formation protein B [Francisella tularensis subsp. holarctica]
MKTFIENDLIKALIAIELMGIAITINSAFYF